MWAFVGCCVFFLIQFYSLHEPISLYFPFFLLLLFFPSSYERRISWKILEIPKSICYSREVTFLTRVLWVINPIHLNHVQSGQLIHLLPAYAMQPSRRVCLHVMLYPWPTWCASIDLHDSSSYFLISLFGRDRAGQRKGQNLANVFVFIYLASILSFFPSPFTFTGVVSARRGGNKNLGVSRRF